MKRAVLVFSARFLLCWTATGLAGEKLPGSVIEQTLNDTTAYYLPLSASSARQYFKKNGETPYIDAVGAKTFGEWSVRGNQYCSMWPPSDHWTCFDVEFGEKTSGKHTITFVSGGNGKRYEAVLKSGNHIEKAWLE